MVCFVRSTALFGAKLLLPKKGSVPIGLQAKLFVTFGMVALIASHLFASFFVELRTPVSVIADEGICATLPTCV